jgi:hypothetical protein
MARRGDVNWNVCADFADECYDLVPRRSATYHRYRRCRLSYSFLIRQQLFLRVEMFQSGYNRANIAASRLQYPCETKHLCG